MTGIVERVAMAYQAKVSAVPWDRLTVAQTARRIEGARAAIEAMREPDKTMCAASEATMDRIMEQMDVPPSWTLSHCGPEVLRAMIDAALSEA